MLRIAVDQEKRRTGTSIAEVDVHGWEFEPTVSPVVEGNQSSVGEKSKQNKLDSEPSSREIHKSGDHDEQMAGSVADVKC